MFKTSKLFVLCCFLVCLSVESKAQRYFFSNHVFNRKAVYLEGLGTGGFYSINYEYLFHDYGLKQGFRGGPSFFINFLDANKPKVFTGNLEYVAFGFGGVHHLEFGVGMQYCFQTYKTEVPYYSADTVLIGYHTYKYNSSGPSLVPRIGYRYQDPDGGFVIRVGYTPLFSFLGRSKTYMEGTLISKEKIPFSTKFLWGGISIGLSFY